MTLQPGQMLSHYRLVEKIGEGGMGVVWKADDTVLGRHVAIKVLPDNLAHDVERLARFRQEARLLASLNHPNIAAIHGLEESDGIRYLVLELVPGQTLAERIARGPLPVDEALTVCRQIAEALESAHETGIIHRDLKPANVKVTPDGKVKVLDFGLAKAFEAGHASGPIDTSLSPTLTTAGTMAGVILGTAAYMSPEQARGNPVDKRTDIWAFGCCLYEALTGKRPFQGDSATQLLARVLEREPDWEALPKETPERARILLWRCLQKNPQRRLRDIGEARFEIGETTSSSSAPFSIPGPTTSQPRLSGIGGWPGVGGALLFGSLVTALLFWNLRPPALSPPQPVRRTSINFSGTHTINWGFWAHTSLALSPDGSRLVYAAQDGARTGLIMRKMDAYSERWIPDTEGAAEPFFSPDGQWIGFFAQSKLKKVAVSGGAVIDICDASFPFGATWCLDDTIILTPVGSGPLWRVPASGGRPEKLTTLDVQNRDQEHSWPHALPDGKTVLFSIWTGGALGDNRIAALSLETGEVKVLFEGGSHPHYVSTGHLIYARGEELLARRFDLATQEVGLPVSVLKGVLAEFRWQIPQFAISESGVLVYAEGGVMSGDSSLVWVDPSGEVSPMTPEKKEYDRARISPGGDQLVYSTLGREPGLWIHDIARGSHVSLASGQTYYTDPVWSPDGEWIAFSSTLEGMINLFRNAADGTGGLQRLNPHSDVTAMASSWSPDGQVLAFGELDVSSAGDIWLVSNQQGAEPEPFLNEPSIVEWSPAFSPDGNWIAYQSDRSGRFEVYATSYPEPGREILISKGGSHRWSPPIWSPTRDEIYYLSAEQSHLMVVEIQSGEELIPGIARPLFETENFEVWDIAPDGERFIGIQHPEQSQISHLDVVFNWFEDLERLVPTESVGTN